MDYPVLEDQWEIASNFQKKRVICMENHLVSIITPCFNGEPYLNRYFSSILQQTYSPLELIFVNDGSADRTAEIAESYRPLLEAKGIRFIFAHREQKSEVLHQE